MESRCQGASIGYYGDVNLGLSLCYMYCNLSSPAENLTVMSCLARGTAGDNDTVLYSPGGAAESAAPSRYGTSKAGPAILMSIVAGAVVVLEL